jgi:predicted esterase
MICSDREADPVALAYLAEGYNTFVLRYSVGTNEPASKAFADAVEAISYIHEHADELNIDKEKIVVVGFSAGGHLAAWLSVYGELKPAAAILGYPCTLSEVGKLLGKELPELCEKVDSATPPTFIFTTRDDPVVPVRHALRYADALERESIDFELHVFAEGAHGLSLARSFTSAGSTAMVNDDMAQWFGLSVNWLKKILGDFPVQEAAPLVLGSALNCDAPLNRLMSNEKTRPLVLEMLPNIAEIIKQAEESGQSDIVNAASVKQLARVRPELLSEESVRALDKRLRDIR